MYKSRFNVQLLYCNTVDSAYSGHLGTGLKWPQYPMALISGGDLVLMWILGHGFSGHYNRLALISVDIISGVYCTNLLYIKFLWIIDLIV